MFIINYFVETIRRVFENPIETAISLLAILLALSVHECAHAYAAFRLGDPTARNLGRMTLNPLKHIDPIGLVCMLLFRFGWAKPVPVNPRNFKNYRRDDIIVSLAGVATNFVVAFLSMLVLAILLKLGVVQAYLIYFFFFLTYISLALMVFNLIPIPPLDGSHVLESLLIKHTGPKPFLFLRKYGYIILLVLVFTGVVANILGTVVTWIIGGFSGLLGAIFSLPELQLLTQLFI